MNDQPREEKAPDGAEQPTVEHPTAATPPTAASGDPAGTPASEPAESASDQASSATAADQTAVHGQQPPPGPQFAQPAPGQPYAAWGPPPAAPRQPGGFRRFVGHRATQLVAVGVLGMLVGGVIVGGIAAVGHHGPRDGRPGIHRQYNGPDQGFNGRGPGFGGRGNAGPGTGDGS
ncbi:hypothetical protein ACWED2_10345 [Amycolatopsis sp. NPDC005003]